MADTPNNPQTPLPGLQDTNEPWALEATLSKVLQVLQRDFAQNAKQGRSIDSLSRNVDKLINGSNKDDKNDRVNQRRELQLSQQNQKILKDIQDSSKNSARAQEEAARNAKISKNQARDNLIGGGGNALTGALRSAIDKTKNTLKNSASGILNSGGDITKAMGDVASSMPGIVGTVLGASVSIVNSARKNLADVSKTGQTFGGNMTTMARSAATAGLSMDQMVGILSENSEAVAKLGGASNFLKLQKQVRMTTAQFNSFGLSVEEQNKVVASFAEYQMARGRRDLANNAQASADYMAQMSGLAKLTGKSIDDLMKTQKDLTNDIDVNTALQRLFERAGPEAAKNAEKVLNKTMAVLPEQAKGPVKDMITTFATFKSVAKSGLGKLLMQGGRTDIIESLNKAIANGDTAALLKSLREANDATQKRDTQFATTVGNLGAAPGAIAPGVFEALRGAGQVSDDVLANINKDQAAQAKTDNALATDKKGKPLPGQAGTVDMTNMKLQEQLGQVYANLLDKATLLYPAIGNLTKAAAAVINKLVGSQTLETAIQRTTDAFNDLTNNIPEMLDSMEGLDKVDGFFNSIVTKIANFGGAVTKAVGLGPGLGELAALSGAAAAAKWGLKAGFNAIKGGGAAAGEGAAAAGAGRMALGTVAKTAGLYYLAGQAGNLLGKGLAAGINKYAPETAQKIANWRDSSMIGRGINNAADLLSMIGIGDGAKKQQPQQPTNQPKPEKPNPTVQPPTEPPTNVKAELKPNPKPDVSQENYLFTYKKTMEKLIYTYQINLIKARHNYEMLLLGIKYNHHAVNTNKMQKQTASQADLAFRAQVDQAKRVGTAINKAQDKAAKMGSLSQTGVIVQPMIGTDIESQQLQEMRLTNQFLYNIYDIQRGTRKFKPLVEMYQPGL